MVPINNKQRRRVVPSIIIATLLVVALFCNHSYAAGAKERTFASPEEAFKNLLEAVKAGDAKRIDAVLGHGGASLFPAGNPEKDRFVQAYEEKRTLQPSGPRKVVLLVGKEDWPWPIPVVKAGQRWRFDMGEGRKEILARNIGANEVAVVQVCLAYVDAQREYAEKHRAGGLFEYARKFSSGEGSTDGLCWEGDKLSPLGPLVANACRTDNPDNPRPYFGYFYRILTKQGQNAPGGAYDYMVNDRMIGGFAMIAYPASYGSSGIKSFLVNQDGVVYEKDLGKESIRIAETMAAFDPDKTWKKVD